MEEKQNFNIVIIAGYDVHAHKIPEHISYVNESVAFGIAMDADLIIFVGGETNPDCPTENEALANCIALKKGFVGKNCEILELENGFDPCSMMCNTVIANTDRSQHYQGKMILSVKVLPFGDTSTETLEAAKSFLEKNKIPIGKLIFCAEQARITGFMLDAMHVGIIDMAASVYAYGHQFPESKHEFEPQRRKMLLKVLSHRNSFFHIIRDIYQKWHQIKVAIIKRRKK